MSKVERMQVGNLRVDNGIVAFLDPCYVPNSLHMMVVLPKTVPNGVYPVFCDFIVSGDSEGRESKLEVVFSDNKVVNTLYVGEMGVDTGQAMISTTNVIRDVFKGPNDDDDRISTYEIYRNKADGKLWQFAWGKEKPAYPNVNLFPGSYQDVIPEYGICPNELNEKGLWEPSGLDPYNHIPKDEVSYRNASRITCSEQMAGELGNGAAVVSGSGWGDGGYPVHMKLDADERPVSAYVMFIDPRYD